MPMPEGNRRPNLVVDVFADPICPWCFIGKRRLERAFGLAGGGAAFSQVSRASCEGTPSGVTRGGGDGIEVRWRAFQLNPGMPPEGMDRALYLATKFGGADRARQVYDAIRRAGETEGIAFAFSRIRRTPNTLAAHRLLRFAAAAPSAANLKTGGSAAGAERAGAVMDGLFGAYFLDGRDIGEAAELAAIAGAAGCDAAAAAAYLAGDQDRAAVLAEDTAARAAGIGGVPHFIVAGRYQLPGAQSPEVIARAIELARAALARPAAGG